MLCGWCNQPGECVEPRLALQLVHEAAVCTAGIRAGRTLHTRGGFELANGLPFVASDKAIHELLAQRSVNDSMRLQVALGRLRRASRHFSGKLLAIDPHRVQSHSRRVMRTRVEKSGHKPVTMAQTFWLLDAETCQPVCFTTATAAVSTVEATPQLLDMAEEILQPAPGQILVVADAEHFSSELLRDVRDRSGFEILVPLPNQPAHRKRWESLDAAKFRRRWAGYATAKVPYEMRYGTSGHYFEFVERTGERPEDWRFKGFVATSDRDEVERLTGDYPQRWHVEEFFNAHQAQGWGRAGTMNLNIRYGQMSMALIAQAAIHQLRQRLGAPFRTWNADHLARDLFFRLDGDVRVRGDTILVTYYNAPNVHTLRACYEHLPEKLSQAGIRPEVPWLYNYKLDFRFR